MRTGAASALAVLILLRSPILNAEDLRQVRTPGLLRVIYSADAPWHIVSLKPDAAPGFERELIEGFAALERLKIEFVVVPASRDRMPALLSGKGDVIIGGAATASRRQQVDFTTEVFPGQYVVVTYQPHAVVTSLEQLRKERVGTTPGGAWAEQVRAALVPRQNVSTSFQTHEDVLKALRSQEISATVLSLAWALVEQRHDPALLIGLSLGSYEQAWAVRKDAPQLRLALNEYVTNMRRSSTWNRLVVKYYGDMALEVLKPSHGTP
jgi:ABC-type amino acid transport substrate-binding protein